MGMEKDKDIKRIRLLKIWEILNRETDEENPIGTEALLQKLAGEGIECVRSTLYEDIKTLQKYGYEVLCVRSTSNMYYVADRSISAPEVLILMDAVQAAGFITEKKTAELVDKVAKLAGSQRGEVLKRNVVEFSVPKSKNENILYSVSEISQAIVRRKKIRFYYFDYDEGYNRAYRMSKKDPQKKRGYKVNPLGTVFDGGYYYLFCYDDFLGECHITALTVWTAFVCWTRTSARGLRWKILTCRLEKDSCSLCLEGGRSWWKSGRIKALWTLSTTSLAIELN